MSFLIRKVQRQNNLIIGASGNSLSIFHFLNLFETTVDSHAVVQNTGFHGFFTQFPPKHNITVV